MNANTPQNFDALVAQAQIAHRLIVGFYQRLLPTIEQVAEELDLTFWNWEPTVTYRPCKKKEQPADHWAWNMVPLMASDHHYFSTNRDTSRVGDFVLNIHVSFDRNYSNNEWEQWGIADGQEPDATQLPMGAAEVLLFLARCDKRKNRPITELWDEADDIEREDSDIGRWQAISPQLNAIYLKKSLAEFIASPDGTIAQLRSLLDAPAP